jgi:methyl-accepting chemotaxis protein
MAEEILKPSNKTSGLKIRTKFILVFVFLVAIISFNNILILQISLNNILAKDLLDRNVISIKGIISSLTDLVLIGDKEGVVNLIFNEKGSRKDLAYILVLDENNKLIASTLTSSAEIDFIIDKNSLSSDKNESVNLINDKNGNKIYDIAERLNYNKGILRSGYFEGQISDTINKIILLMIFSAGISLLVAVIFSFFLAKIFLKPLEFLKNTASKVAEGDLHQRAKVNSGDEVGYLASVFNKMLNNIESAQIELKESEEKLEKRVQERTLELENLKNDLEKEVDDRTKEMKKQLEEMEKIQSLTIGRELKMAEIKRKIEELKQENEKLKQSQNG